VRCMVKLMTPEYTLYFQLAAAVEALLHMGTTVVKAMPFHTCRLPGWPDELQSRLPYLIITSIPSPYVSNRSDTRRDSATRHRQTK
jgi:hypothetical protein